METSRLTNLAMGRQIRMEASRLTNPACAGGQSGILRTNQPGNRSNDQFGNSRTPIIDTVGQISAEINWEYALIERLDERDLSTHLIRFASPAQSTTPHLRTISS